MSIILASYISNSKNTAYFMNSLKIDGRTITLYNDKDSTFSSSVDIPEQSMPEINSVPYPVKRAYNVGELISDSDKASDCTAKLQEYIDTCAENGGGALFLGAGVYRVTTLELKSRVSLIGLGPTQTIIKRIVNNATSYDKSFIYVSPGCIGFNIQDLSINGDCVVTGSEDPVYQISGYTSYTEGDYVTGLYIASCPTVANYTDGRTSIVNAYLPLESTGSLEHNSPYKFSSISNVVICGFTKHGLYIGTNVTNLSLNNVTCNINKGDGISCNGNNILMNNIVVCGNGSNGLYLGGTLNKATNVRADFNGKYNHMESSGIYLDGSYNSITNVSTKYNWSTGIKIITAYNSICNSICDANGPTYDDNENARLLNPKDVPQMYVSGNGHTIHNAKFFNYRANTNVTISLTSIQMDNITNSEIDCLIMPNSGAVNPLYDNNAIDHNEYYNHSDYGNNIISLRFIS